MIKAQQHIKSVYLLLTVSLLLCILVGVCLSTGLVDAILIARDRPQRLSRVDSASNNNPPDIEFLIDALQGPDWYVAAVAAERIGQLWQSGSLENGQATIAVQALFSALASDGHWWRFGWDRDEPEFEQFRGAAIASAAKFGAKIYPRLLAATNSNSPFEREAACWITLGVLKSDPGTQVTLIEWGIRERIESLAQSDPCEGVRASCTAVLNEISSQKP